jgi:hypothetical protein
LIVGIALLGSAARALAGGRLGIDHPIAPSDSGIWARKYTLGLEYGVVASKPGGGLWLGGASEFGLTIWQTIVASVIG